MRRGTIFSGIKVVRVGSVGMDLEGKWPIGCGSADVQEPWTGLNSLVEALEGAGKRLLMLGKLIPCPYWVISKSYV